MKQPVFFHGLAFGHFITLSKAKILFGSFYINNKSNSFIYTFHSKVNLVFFFLFYSRWVTNCQRFFVRHLFFILFFSFLIIFVKTADKRGGENWLVSSKQSLFCHCLQLEQKGVVWFEWGRECFVIYFFVVTAPFLWLHLVP